MENQNECSPQVDVTKIMEEIQRRVKEKKRTGLYKIDRSDLITSKMLPGELDTSAIKDLELRLRLDLQGANAFWGISCEYDDYPGKGLIGRIKNEIKRIANRIIKPYLTFTMSQQVRTNAAVVKVLNDIYEILAKDRMRAMDADFDYLGFENLHRGTPEVIKERQKKYVQFFKGCRNVVDLGCGRGEFLDLLKEHNVGAYGVDSNLDMVNTCRQKGHSVRHDDIINHMESLPDYSVDGVFMAQVIEHLDTKDMVYLLKLILLKLSMDANLVIETLNPASFSALALFYVDPLHKQPVHPLALEAILKGIGFRKVDVAYTTELPREARLQLIESLETRAESISPLNKNALDLINQNFAKLNHLLYSHQEYYVVATKQL